MYARFVDLIIMVSYLLITTINALTVHIIVNYANQDHKKMCIL